MVKQARRVIAVEIDRDLAARLPSSIQSERLEVLQMDALELDPAALGLVEYTLVANLPYHITSPLLTRFLHQVQRPQRAVLMMQREVAERISAGPGHLSYLAIAVQCVADVEIIRQVPPSAFVPRPKVDSTVLRLTPRPDAIINAHFLPFVRAGFTQPRKRLANSLAQGLGVPKPEVESFLSAHDLPEQARPHEISVDQWHQLSGAWARQRQP
jgi:16S rRNA (adenine1518-N6/adenine1519-N6)-dimethyltransferase